ncbi:MAG: tetratricopeptide repeat protein [Actinomycetota bacterium]
MNVKVAPGVDVPMRFSIQGLGHMYIELLQLGERYLEALEVAESLEPDQIAALAVCENEVQLRRWKDVLETTEDIENEDDATALLLIFRAIAFREEGKLDASIETLRLARSSRKRHEDILNKALYERSFLYEKQGKKALARKDLEKILATDSDFPGVDQRLKDLE